VVVVEDQIPAGRRLAGWWIICEAQAFKVPAFLQQCAEDNVDKTRWLFRIRQDL
jgi:hypothetical protein